MKSQEKKEIQITLVLNAEEASWLKALMQNPINESGDPEVEPEHEAAMRKSFWEELSKYDLY